jgi:hypothetical protein
VKTREEIGDASVATVWFAKEYGDFITELVWVADAVVEGDKGGIFVLGWELVVRVKMQTHRREMSTD